jgi:rare lipoprotein A
LFRKLIALSIVVLCFAAGGSAATSTSNARAWASWYGPGLYGNGMGCGGTLTTSTWGVAHKTLPCGTRLTICYQRCAHVTVIDRGPFVAGREFDLTYPVKSYIGMPSVGRVRWWRG